MAARGRGKLDSDLTESRLAQEAKKKEEYRSVLTKQIEDEKARKAREKEEKKRQEMVEEERVMKEIKEREKKILEEKEANRQRERQMMHEQEAVLAERMRADTKTKKRENSTNGFRQERQENLARTESRNEMDIHVDNLPQMIKTNQNWINTTLSKEYVMHNKREKDEQSPQPPRTQSGSSAQSEADQFRTELYHQLERAKQEAKAAIEKRDKAERMLTGLKQEYHQKIEEAKKYKGQLENALLRTNPGHSGINAVSEMEQYSVLDSVAQSVALECQTQFVGMEAVAASDLTRIANSSFLKVAKQIQRAPLKSADLNVEDPEIANIDKIVQELEQRIKWGKSPQH